MKKKHDIPEQVVEVLKEIGMSSAEAGWNCHGTYVLLHKALEKVAAKRNVVFDPPQVLSANVTSKEAVVLCTGRMGDKQEWSIGEAAPYNNKNSYPFAMAEKRAKDRVILKLVGLHGDVYSEDEADAFQESAPINMAGTTLAGKGDPVEEETIEPVKKVEKAKKKNNQEEVPSEDEMVAGDNLPSAKNVEEWDDKFTQHIVTTMIEWMQGLETFTTKEGKTVLAIDQAKDYHLANKSLREAIQKHKPEFHAQYVAALEIIKKEKRGA
jgi:hypothetical protein